jgi:pentatricopeptide repeat domain-containing protein 1
MLNKGITPDQILCIRLLRKYYELGDIDEAQELRNDMLRRGLVDETMET